MPRQPRLTGQDVLRALRRAGWQIARQRGSHVLLRRAEPPSRLVTVPLHAGRTLKPKTLASILDQVGMSLDEFRRLL